MLMNACGHFPRMDWRLFHKVSRWLQLARAGKQTHRRTNTQSERVQYSPGITRHAVVQYDTILWQRDQRPCAPCRSRLVVAVSLLCSFGRGFVPKRVDCRCNCGCCVEPFTNFFACGLHGTGLAEQSFYAGIKMGLVEATGKLLACSICSLLLPLASSSSLSPLICSPPPSHSCSLLLRLCPLLSVDKIAVFLRLCSTT